VERGRYTLLENGSGTASGGFCPGGDKKWRMRKSDYIKFLGTAGARYVVSKQLRASGGIFLSLKGKRIILDPGPGSLVRCSHSRPPIEAASLDALILSHSHIDHSNDINILIDAMTYGGFEKRGVLYAPWDCLYGDDAVVLKYLRGYLDGIVTLEPERSFSLGDLSFTTSITHRHPVETYGITFDYDGKKLAFMVDTRFFPSLLDSYRDIHTLVMNVVRYPPLPEESDILHLTFHDVREIVTSLSPGRVILTHFGMTMLKNDPTNLARSLSDETGIDIKAATDGMVVDL